MGKRPGSWSRTALVGTLAALGAVPVATGVAGGLVGTRAVAGGGRTRPSIDSEFRFLNVWWTAVGPVLWWSLRAPEDRVRTTRTVLALTGAGGLTRLLSCAQDGRPHPLYLAVLGLDLSAFPLLLWHRSVLGLAR